VNIWRSYRQEGWLFMRSVACPV